MKKADSIGQRKNIDMGKTCIYYNGAHIIGNFNKITRRKPKNWIENGYKIIVPYRFKWRDKFRKVECDCKVCEEHFMPYYGTTWYHSNDCTMIKEIDRRPQTLNLNQYYGINFRIIATTE